MNAIHRIGQGYDLHRLVTGRPLILGGVRIDSELGLAGHSDADVLIHAVIDALLGAAALGDIGQWFPDTDPQYKGADSVTLLKVVLKALTREHWQIVNVDVTVVAEKPKLKDYKPLIAKNLAAIMHVPDRAVNIKAKTNEGLGPVGTGQAMACHTVVGLAYTAAE